ncbi:MAG: hypothetical protein H0X34_17875 [Chthoniobacterales bacterium]|nr:hypothetical protein [Chthoniobacterales bacterium]
MNQQPLANLQFISGFPKGWIEFVGEMCQNGCSQPEPPEIKAARWRRVGFTPRQIMRLFGGQRGNLGAIGLLIENGEKKLRLRAYLEKKQTA